jgi:ABC-type thiamin/hydroxymethylpyrimidine transport system permease subunit
MEAKAFNHVYIVITLLCDYLFAVLLFRIIGKAIPQKDPK